MSLPNKPNRQTTFERKSVKFEVVVVSTAHVKATDGELMLQVEAPYLEYIAGGGCGAAFQIPESDALLNAAFSQWKAFGFSEAFVSLMQELNHAGVTVVLLDADGPVYSRFPTYDW